MPFEPWQEHEVLAGDERCIRCDIQIPRELHEHVGLLYSHHYVDGSPVFCLKPQGRHAPCHSDK